MVEDHATRPLVEPPVAHQPPLRAEQHLAHVVLDLILAERHVPQAHLRDAALPHAHACVDMIYVCVYVQCLARGEG